MKTRIFLVDDHKLMREGLLKLLEKESAMEVIGEADNGRVAIQLVKKLLPDVVIMDVAMPDLNGIEATRQIVSKIPGVRIIALSMHSNRQYVIEMFKAGASGYLLKECAFEELIRAVRNVILGRTYLCPRVSNIIVEDYGQRFLTTDSSAYTLLTPRQREVISLLAEGKSTKQIAFHLGVSIKTVETHRQQIMDRLDIHNLAGLIKYALHEGLTSL